MTSHLILASNRSNAHCNVVKKELSSGMVDNKEYPKMVKNYCNAIQESADSRSIGVVKMTSVSPLHNTKNDEKSMHGSFTGEGTTSTEATAQQCSGAEGIVARENNPLQHEKSSDQKKTAIAQGETLRKHKFHLSSKDAELPLKTIYNCEAFQQFASDTPVVGVGHFNLQSVLPQVRNRSIRFLWAEGRGSFGAVYCVTITCPCCCGLSRLEDGKPRPVHQYGGTQGGNGNAPQYVLKKIPQSFIEQQKGDKDGKEPSRETKQRFSQAVTDLLLEAHILASLHHPNIIRVKGSASSDTKAKDFFFLMERLRCNLSHRIHHSWARKQEAWSHDSEFWSTSKLPRRINSFLRNATARKLNKLWVERITVARDIASALTYMHEHRILHRDIKPKNIGFAMDDTVKLFDFGTAVQIPSDDPKCFVHSGRVGSRRYMAPEVFSRKPYNEAADVYSFVLVFWEMLTFEKPPDWNANLTSTKEDFVSGEGANENTASTKSKSLLPERTVPSHERAPIPVEWSLGIRNAISLGWSYNPRDRLTASSFVKVLEAELDKSKLKLKASQQ